ncbi:MAG TPA: hypothetical protein VHG91_10960 [Longimicrobium sp.]|nr:hypothetical protein [Longimicrobium sp.]
MNRLSRTFAALLGALLLPAGAAAAQSIPSPYRYLEETQGIQAFAGYLFTDPTINLSDSTAADFGPRSGPLFGLRYGVRVGGPLTFEAGVGFSPSDRKVYAAEAVADSTEIRVLDTGATTSTAVLIGEAALRFSLTGPRAYRGFAPFVRLSGGLAADLAGSGDAEEDLPETERFDFGPAFAVGLGAGTDIYVTPRASIRLQLDGRLWRQSAPEGFRPVNVSGISEWNNASSATVGAVLHF